MQAKLFLCGVLLLVVSACGPAPAPKSPFKSTDITGATFARDFQLTDHNLKRRSLNDFKGKVVMLFFGYTHCPDVCPTTLAEFATALKKLGADADKVQVLFVTLDPERDTPALLAQYVPAFYPSFLGLFGSDAETKTVAQEFKIVYQKNTPENAQAGYTLDHSAGSFVFDQSGKVRLLVPYGLRGDFIAEDLKILLRER